MCVCLIGWQGADCSECRPYWQCPNQDPSAIDSVGNPRTPACILPNQCFCDEATASSDTSGYCNLSELNGDTPIPFADSVDNKAIEGSGIGDKIL